MEIVRMFWNISPILLLGIIISMLYWGMIRTAQSNLKSYFLTSDEAEVIKQYRMNKK